MNIASAMKLGHLPHTSRSWGKAHTSAHVLCTAFFLPVGGCFAQYSAATTTGQQQPTPSTSTTPIN